MKPRLRLIILCLAFGALVNVGVAWWIAWKALPFDVDRGFAFSDAGRDGWFFRRADGFGSVRLEGTPASAWQSSGASERQPILLPAWSRMNAAASPSTAVRTEQPQPMIEHGRGWPFITLSSSYEAQATRGWMRTYAVFDAIELPVDQTAQLRLLQTGTTAPEPPALPLRIWWLGTLLNTLIYALVLWVLVMVLSQTLGRQGMLRRSIRKRRGRCVRCAYDLRHDLTSGCPECGWGRSADVSE